MTRSQVRAAMRRMRDHNEEIEEEAGEINLVPYMDIVTNIIIFLLASVVNQVALGNINVSSPTLVRRRRRRGRRPPPEKPPLNLTVSVGRHRFHDRRVGRRPAGDSEAAERPVRLQRAHDEAAGDQVAPDNAEETKANFNADANIALRHRRSHPGRHATSRRRQDPVP